MAGKIQLDTWFLRLLGPVRVERPQKAENKTIDNELSQGPRFRSRRTVALLGYLAVERRKVSRDFLAALFWPDEEPSKARTNLRRELHNLAQILPDCWALDHQMVAFMPSAGITVDLYAVLDLQARGRWDEAIKLLNGEFLEGLYLEDNLAFEQWLLAERDRWRTRAGAVLTHMIDVQTHRGRYTEALHLTRRLLKLMPWSEQAHQRLMRLLSWTGQRGAAIRAFKNCEKTLWDELGVEPAEETIVLYRQIRSGELNSPPLLPAFLTEEVPRHQADQPPFVARERQLARMDSFLKSSQAGQARVIFVTGGPGRGKTALLNAFTHRAMEAFPDLLVASGSCNAFSGAGDPYLPFRDVMAMLTGDVEAKWEAGAIASDHAMRLWDGLSLVTQALLDKGPDLLDILIPSAALLSRAAIADQAGSVDIMRLRQHLATPGKSSKGAVERSFLFEQASAVLHTVAKEKPLLIILDDIQWADNGSIDLLFHLGRRLGDLSSRILIACAYRPEEIALSRRGERHPLSKVLSEFKRVFGDVWINLSLDDRDDGRTFVDALLDSEPNRLGDGFRNTLFQRTQGHPLFTTELLRTMRDLGDIHRDEQGYWIESSELDWEVLPVRVEAVIGERVERLEPELQELLSVASVEGEIFTAQVVAEVCKLEEKAALSELSEQLERNHRLINAQGEVQIDHKRMSRYRFGHVLFQEYLYKRLSPGQQQLLHGEVATVLEKLYADQLDGIAVQLGHHFYKAGEYERAFQYFFVAAEKAARIHAYDETRMHYTQSIELSEKVSLNAAVKAGLYHGRGLACEMLGDFDCAQSDFEEALKIAQPAGEQEIEWRILIDLGKLWASRDYQRTRNLFERALELAHRMNVPALLAGSLNSMGNWYANDEKPAKAAAYHQQALEIVECLDDPHELANTLDLLGIANLLGGNHDASVRYYDRAIDLYKELEDRPGLLTSLMGRGTNLSLQVLLTTAPAVNPPDARHDILEAIRLAREIHSPPEEAWADWTLGLLYTVYGQFGEALKIMQAGLQIATEIGHREWLVGNQFALGVLLVEIFAPGEALQHLEQALDLARGLRSQYWIHHVIGALAAAHITSGNLESAQTSLDSVLTPQIPMDTMGKRYCWARKAQLAIAQGDLNQALDIAERLIDSAPGRQSGSVITFLWMLKAEAFAGLGQLGKAVLLFQAAIDNAVKQGERYRLWQIHASLGRLYLELGSDAKASDEFSTARLLIGELAGSLPDAALKKGFFQAAHRAITMNGR